MSEPPNTTESASSASESAWDFPGWGTAEHIEDLDTGPVTLTTLDSGAIHKLGVWRSTAICGNDITSSCLYVTAIAAVYAGPYAPLALAMVAGVLYLFRSIYTEVGTALPLNGGAYNVLLNTTTKGQASVAACLTILSYIATAVISAYAAMSYGHALFGGLNVFGATLVLLALFAVLNLIGITESSAIALGIFLFHILTLVLLVVVCATGASGHIFALNWQQATPGGAWHAIFSGSARRCWESAGLKARRTLLKSRSRGCFRRLCETCGLIVAVFNPVISLLALSLLPLATIQGHTDDLLAHLGFVAAGPWLRTVVSVDAVLVLSGAVLTSFVGVTGLMRRMSLDRCLPQFLLQENKWRRTNHWIILLFLALCVSILFITHGQLLTLGGVYTIAFLGVMLLFAVGNILLKIKRARLPREARAPWPFVLLAVAAMAAALVGNILLNPRYVEVFLLYFSVAGAAVGLMLLRVRLLRMLLGISEVLLARRHGVNTWFSRKVRGEIKRINSRELVFFTEDDSLPLLNEMALYVLQNEQNKRLRVVHCYTDAGAIPPASGCEYRHRLTISTQN